MPQLASLGPEPLMEERLPVLSIKADDAVGLDHGKSALQIVQGGLAFPAATHLLGGQLASKQSLLCL